MVHFSVGRRDSDEIKQALDLWTGAWGMGDERGDSDECQGDTSTSKEGGKEEKNTGEEGKGGKGQDEASDDDDEESSSEDEDAVN